MKGGEVGSWSPHGLDSTCGPPTALPRISPVGAREVVGALAVFVLWVLAFALLMHLLGGESENCEYVDALRGGGQWHCYPE